MLKAEHHCWSNDELAEETDAVLKELKLKLKCIIVKLYVNS